jgi:hypothetical protein
MFGVVPLVSICRDACVVASECNSHGVGAQAPTWCAVGADLQVAYLVQAERRYRRIVA